MPLNTPQLALDIEALLTDQSTREDDPATARRVFAQRLAAAIATHIRTGTVTTTGTAAAQTGIVQ